jgi:glycosyltransferase involved in cell wall biosynthesis
VEKYIRACLNSIVNQTYKDIEIIIVDDCGADNSLRAAEEYAKKDRRIKIIRNDKNMGLSYSRNNGMKNSSAPYIMFCDSDDAYKPDMCEKMLAGIETGADCAVCAAEVVCHDCFADKKLAGGSYFDVEKEGLYILSSKISINVMAWNKIYRRDIIEKYNLEFPVGLYYEDNPFWFAYRSLCAKIFFIKDKLYVYNRRGGTITSDGFSGKTSVRFVDNIRNAVYLYEWFVKNALYERSFEYYWQCFKNLLQGSLNQAGITQKDREAAYDMAISFISDKQTDLELHEIKAISKKRFHCCKEYKKILGMKIIKIKHAQNKRKIYFCGIPVYMRKFI